jgi:hypothetical protein
MTETTPLSAAVRQERDDLPRRKVYFGAAVLVLLLAAGAVATWLADRGAPGRASSARGPGPAKVVSREIQSIDQAPFSAHVPSRGSWSAKRQALDSYEWVDRERGIVRIPVERAMALIVERDRVD